MKQILYFLIGFLISVMCIDATYATQYYENPSSGYDYEAGIGGTYGQAPYFTSDNHEYYHGSPGPDLTGYTWFVTLRNSADFRTDVYTCLVSVCGNDPYVYRTITRINNAALLSNFSDTPVLPDADGDGIPDDQDPYPNDSSPVSVKLASYQTVDGTANGEHIRECYVTDRGDPICIGADYDETKTNYMVLKGTWKDYADIVGTTDTDGNLNPDTQGTEPEQPDYTTNAPTGDAPTDTDDKLKPGTQSDGSETDSESLTGIRDNTGAIADNTKRQGEYLRDMNAAIQNMDRNQTAEIERQKDREQQQEQEAQSGIQELTDFDPIAGLSEVNADLIEGEDYEEPGALAEETWVSEFISSNPLKTIFDNSGFQYTSASSTATLNLGSLGQHVLDISPLESGIITFGNLLVALTTLAGTIHLATGRGF